MVRLYGFVFILTGPDILEQQDNRQSAGFPNNVFCSFLDIGEKFSFPDRTFTAQVPHIPAPPQLPVIFAFNGYTSTINKKKKLNGSL